MDGVAFGADTQLFGTNPSQRADVTAFQIVCFHHCFLRFADFLFGEGQLHAQNFGAVKKAVGVLVQTENGRAIGGFVGANTFKGAAAVVQGVG